MDAEDFISEQEKEVCAKMGITPEEWLTARRDRKNREHEEAKAEARKKTKEEK